MKERRFQILLVDDQPNDMSAITYLTQVLELETTMAFDGTEALQLAAQKRYDLIILDWQMPVMPGWEFLRRLDRELRKTHSKFPLSENVVLHTGETLHVHEFSNESVYRILDVWQKPLTSLELLKRMKEVREMIGA